MTDVTSMVATQFGGAAACAYILNLAQRWTKIPWITEHTTGINRVVRAVLALATTIGIGWAWSSGAAGSHVLSITIPSGVDLIHGLWHWFVQYAMTHFTGNVLQAFPESPKQQ